MTESNQTPNPNKTISKALWAGALLCLFLGTVSLTKPDLFLGLPGVSPEELKIGGFLLLVVGLGDAIAAKIVGSKAK